MDAGTGIPGAHLRGAHLRLPGWGDNGPTLEIFTYNITAPGEPSAVNRLGFGHIAFSVEDVQSARATVLEAGGRAVGEVVTVQIVTGARVTWCYVTDPEGNIIELQSWAPQSARTIYLSLAIAAAAGLVGVAVGHPVDIWFGQ